MPTHESLVESLRLIRAKSEAMKSLAGRVCEVDDLDELRVTLRTTFDLIEEIIADHINLADEMIRRLDELDADDRVIMHPHPVQ